MGKKRAQQSQMTLFNLAGFAMLTLTTKKKEGKFIPVGEEEYVGVIKTPDGFKVILADEDGFTKAQSKAVDKKEAMEIYEKARSKEIPSYNGEEVVIWTEQYPTVHNKGKDSEGSDKQQ